MRSSYQSFANSFASLSSSHLVDFLTNRPLDLRYIPTYQNFEAGIRKTCKESGYPRPNDLISDFLCLDSATLMVAYCWLVNRRVRILIYQ